MDSLEKRVHKALLESTLSNSEIARRCKVARSTIPLWKEGRAIRSDNLAKVCEILGIDDSLELSLRPIQKNLVRTISALPEEHDHILKSLETLLQALDQKSNT
ncbi:hypothetical protein BS333_21280 (plasmid) [Vibrio azureus]|uniref:HTH cro/C1-type domain-containing protein n=1 Tax=Vibrio azureus NBRC 104587 TaxID=1219077 RepID=U3ASF7_9VIBR|nr:transcriptional regulator [Vibrio azureus]AUI88915.1 hypothetical protein BS333_21280 [Vibrio azureus]GAD76182.1 hypothetical protein VAZ01S_039_00070 [Vibrio azureus NBRC 104587]